jgi:hypothetical protein
MTTSLGLLPAWLQITLAIVPSIGAALAAAGLWLNVQQSRRTNKQSRAALVSNTIREFSNDEDMRAIFYSIEYSEFQYEDDFHNSPEERKLDKVLVHFSNLALAWQAGLLTDTDIEPVTYFVRRLLRDKGVKQYLQFVEVWSDHADLGEHPYAALTKMVVL